MEDKTFDSNMEVSFGTRIQYAMLAKRHLQLWLTDLIRIWGRGFHARSISLIVEISFMDKS